MDIAAVHNLKKYFNTEGLCRPKKHYMVNLEDRLDQIKDTNK